MRELNDTLIECAKLRGVYPLMHRTLHEFNWFVNVCLCGWSSFDEWRCKESLKTNPTQLNIGLFRRQKEEYISIHEKWKDSIIYDENYLPRIAEAFLEYCHKEYDYFDVAD